MCNLGLVLSGAEGCEARDWDEIKKSGESSSSDESAGVMV